MAANFYKLTILLLLGLSAFLWFQTCHPAVPNPVITQNKVINDSVNKILAHADSARIRTGLLMEDTIRLHADLTRARDSLREARRLIDAANEQTTALANEIADAHMAKDTARFISSCDSLAIATRLAQSKFTAYKTQADKTLSDCNTLSLNKSNIIAQLSAAASGYQQAGELLRKENTRLSAAVNPTRKVFIGGEVYVAPGSAGVGPGIMYMDKNERMYGVAGGVSTQGGWWIGGKVYFKIHL